MYADGLGPLEGRYRADGFDAWAALEGDGILHCVNDVELSRLKDVRQCSVDVCVKNEP